MDKAKLCKMAEELAKKHKNGMVSDTQLRNYVNVAKTADCFEEYVVYLKYQMARISRKQDAQRKFMKDVIDTVENNIRNLGDSAYFFGVLSRYKKYLDSENERR